MKKHFVGGPFLSSISRRGEFIPKVKTLVLHTVVLQTIVLTAAVLAFPAGTLAQRGGGGGGHIGGANAGGDGLSSTGKPTGIDSKDDLKNFYEALAVQATSQQVIEYKQMLKSTDAASADLQVLLAQARKENIASDIATRRKSFEQSLETALALNRRFLDGLSDRQKSGLKEIVKKLTKTDSDLSQRVKALDLETGDAKSGSRQIADSALSLDHELASFHNQQLDLGQEMDIGAGNNTLGAAFNILPVKTSVNVENQPIAITTSGIISKDPAENGQNVLKLELTEDMSDLQQNVTGVLRAAIDKAERCGERISILSAALNPLPPASVVVAKLHFERWACFGRDVNELAEGDGTIEVKLTPAIAADGTIRLLPEIARVDASGLVGDLLRSGSVGETVRDKVAESLSPALPAPDFKTILPPTSQGHVMLRHARFLGTGLEKLSIVLDGDIRVSAENVSSLGSEHNTQTSSSETAHH